MAHLSSKQTNIYFSDFYSLILTTVSFDLSYIFKCEIYSFPCFRLSHWICFHFLSSKLDFIKQSRLLQVISFFISLNEEKPMIVKCKHWPRKYDKVDKTWASAIIMVNKEILTHDKKPCPWFSKAVFSLICHRISFCYKV